jgi:pimeloyl-ACP methyl ester carboxylesterase
VAIWIAATHPGSVRRLALWGIPLLSEDLAEKLANEEPMTYSDDGSEIAKLWQLRENYPGMGFSRMVDFLVSVLQMKETKPWAHRALGRADMRGLITQVT